MPLKYVKDPNKNSASLPSACSYYNAVLDRHPEFSTRFLGAILGAEGRRPFDYSWEVIQALL